MIPANPDLSQLPNAVQVFKKPIPVTAAFAESDGVCSTLEGNVRFRTGDAILTGVQGEQWPVRREKFLATYEPCDGTTSGMPGLYIKKKILVWALELDQPYQVKVGWQSDELKGSLGDWLIQYGEGDYGIVNQNIFSETYDRADLSR